MPSDALGARTPIHYFTEAYGVTTTDALVPITGVLRGSAAPVTTQLTVPAGKVLRIERIMVTGVHIGTAIGAHTVRLRVAFGAAAALTSPPWWTGRLASPQGTLAANQAIPELIDPIPEGLEFPAGAGLQFSAQATAAAASLTFSLLGFEYNA